MKSSTSTTAFVSVKWPTSERLMAKELSKDLTTIGVKLLKGTYSEIATHTYRVSCGRIYII